jgi:hypothetical protein
MKNAVGQRLNNNSLFGLAIFTLRGSMRRFYLARPLEGIHAGNRKLRRPHPR